MIYLFPTCLGMVLWCVKQVDSGYSCSWGRGDVVHCLDIPSLLSASLRFTIWYQLPSVCDGSDGRGANGNKDALFLFFVIRTLQSSSPRQCPRHPPPSAQWPLAQISTLLHPVPKLAAVCVLLSCGEICKWKYEARVPPCRHHLVWTCLQEVIKQFQQSPGAWWLARQNTPGDLLLVLVPLSGHPVPSEAAPGRPWPPLSPAP